MPPFTYEDAFNATNPNLNDEQRDQSARAILAGRAANDAYWNSRSDLEALRARAEGHGVVVRGSDDEDESPTAVGTGTGGESPPIEATATEEGTTVLAPGESASVVAGPASATTPPQPESVQSPAQAPADTTPETTPTTPAQAPAPSPDNPTEAVATLRKQLADAGMTPEA